MPKKTNRDLYRELAGPAGYPYGERDFKKDFGDFPDEFFPTYRAFRKWEKSGGYNKKQKGGEIKVNKFNTGGAMLKGKQKKLDKNNNGRIDAEDFKLLQGSKKGMRMGGVAGYGAARKSGMGLQDESMKPGKIIKAKSGYGMSSNKKRAMAEARARREQER